MKRIFQVVKLLLLALLVGTGSSMVVLADEQELYSITVVKVAIEDESKVANNFPKAGLPVEQIQDDEGNRLKPLSGIHYTVERVTPMQHSFKELSGENALKMEVVTDAEGIAHFDQLPQGTYRVIEQPNEQITKVMEPVVLELPLPQAQGQSLEDVYLYPKSSVFSGLSPLINVPEQPDTKEPASNPEGNLPNQPSANKPNRDSQMNGSNQSSVNNPNYNYQANISNQPGAKNPIRIPQTNGTIGNVYPIIWSIFFVLFMGAMGVASLNWKKKKY